MNTTDRLARFATSMAAMNGDVVTQGHTLYCEANGHATWTSNGHDLGVCPRCGAVLFTDATDAAARSLAADRAAAQDADALARATGSVSARVIVEQVALDGTRTVVADSARTVVPAIPNMGTFPAVPATGPLSVACPACGERPGWECKYLPALGERYAGQVRKEPHRARKDAAGE